MSSTHRHDDMSSTRRLLSQNSASKLSPRALVTQPLSKQLQTGRIRFKHPATRDIRVGCIWDCVFYSE